MPVRLPVNPGMSVYSGLSMKIGARWTVWLCLEVESPRVTLAVKPHYLGLVGGFPKEWRIGSVRDRIQIESTKPIYEVL